MIVDEWFDALDDADYDIVSGKEGVREAAAFIWNAARKQALEEAARIASSHATCGCNGARGRCVIDDAPLAIAAAIRERASAPSGQDPAPASSDTP